MVEKIENYLEGTGTHVQVLSKKELNSIETPGKIIKYCFNCTTVDEICTEINKLGSKDIILYSAEIVSIAGIDLFEVYMDLQL